MFGKIMSIPDGLMWSYYELVTDLRPDEIAALRNDSSSGKLHPMDLKMRLAQEVIAGFHGPDAAQKAAAEFQRVFRDRQAPEEPIERHLPIGPAKKIGALLVELGMVVSKSEAERLIKQGGVEMDGVRVEDSRREVNLATPGGFLLRAGKKKFLRILVG